MADAAETMRDRGKFWTPVPNWRSARLSGEGWSARRVFGLGQTLVSGDLEAALDELSFRAPEVGLCELAEGAVFSVRIARDRVLLVTPSPLLTEPGWRNGWAATPCDDLHAVLELEGERVTDLIAEGTSAAFEAGSRSAAVQLAGVPVLLYRVAPAAVRLHVEAPFAAYLWTWLERTASNP